tara:strand:+ start:3138 stop:3338 length:201 start_codon:yes stop_codon:yes gene_type:complete
LKNYSNQVKVDKFEIRFQNSIFFNLCKLSSKKTYQQDPGNVREAIREAELDQSEGADIMMVKPAGA